MSVNDMLLFLLFLGILISGLISMRGETVPDDRAKRRYHKPRYILVHKYPPHVCVGVYDSPEKLGIGYIAKDSRKAPLILRATHYAIEENQIANRYTFRELTADEALRTGVPLERWAM